MFIVGLALFGFGYAVFYYGANVLVDAYVRTNNMNPAPFTVLLGLPGATGSGNAGSPSDNGNPEQGTALNQNPTGTVRANQGGIPGLGGFGNGN
jgi:hypothetical protein